MVKYYGRWPFLRVFGINEFASVVLSLLNMLPCLYGLWVQGRRWVQQVRRRRTNCESDHDPRLNGLQKQHLLATVVFFLFGCNTWLQSALFHAVENPVTTLLDTMSVQVALCYCLIYGCLLHALGSNWTSTIFSARNIRFLVFFLVCFVGVNFGTSLWNLLFTTWKHDQQAGNAEDGHGGQEDGGADGYGVELDAGNSFLVHVGFFLGGLSGLLILSVPWAAGVKKASGGGTCSPAPPPGAASVGTSPFRPLLGHASMWIAILGAHPFAIVFEIYDFPPVFGLLDSHAMWHLGTVPLQTFWLVFFRDVEPLLAGVGGGGSRGQAGVVEGQQDTSNKASGRGEKFGNAVAETKKDQ